MVMQKAFQHAAQIRRRFEIACLIKVGSLQARPVRDHAAALDGAACKQRNGAGAVIRSRRSIDARGTAKLRHDHDRGIPPFVAKPGFKIGERAFNAFVASRAGEGGFTEGPVGNLAQNLFLATEVSIERACATLNDNERRMRESLMVSATEIAVNEELYKVYRAVGPKNWLEAARLICEEKATPRDVIARLDLSPVEIEECMKDLIRRGVVTLKKA